MGRKKYRLTEEMEDHVFHVRGTGHPISPTDVGLHIATIQDGVFWWHLFGSLERGMGC